jgi:thioredoxin 1
MSKQVIEVSDGSFEKEVLGSDQPVLVDFWAEWCGPCRMIAPTVERVAEQYAGRARVAKVNVDDNPATAQRYGIKGIPTLILFHEGREAERIVGAVSGDALARVIEKHVGATS